MSWVDSKYLNLLSSRLDRFRRTDDRTVNFRCPICGDSAKNKYKARAYVYTKGSNYVFHCFNCNASMPFFKLLREVDPGLYREYRIELLKENGKLAPARSSNDTMATIVNVDDGVLDPLKSLKTISQLSPDHPVRAYVASRLIPDDRLDKLYYATRFMEWVNTVIPGKFDERQLKMDEPRLVIPFVGDDGVTFAVTGRSFKRATSVKYLTVKFDDRDKVFGMDSVDPSRRVYIVEGPIDSFFLDNSIAFAGSSGTVPDFLDSVIVLDNEPRNREIVRLMEKFADSGRKVCVWPQSMEVKDLNDLAVAGLTSDDIKNTIDKNTYQGLTAKLKLAEWRAVR